jgi:CheY-like chemotaxis protein
MPRALAVDMTQSLKVLVVDDDAVARAALQRVIADLGHDCRSARDGLDALEPA